MAHPGIGGGGGGTNSAVIEASVRENNESCSDKSSSNRGQPTTTWYHLHRHLDGPAHLHVALTPFDGIDIHTAFFLMSVYFLVSFLFLVFFSIQAFIPAAPKIPISKSCSNQNHHAKYSYVSKNTNFTIKSIPNQNHQMLNIFDQLVKSLTDRLRLWSAYVLSGNQNLRSVMIMN